MVYALQFAEDTVTQLSPETAEKGGVQGRPGKLRRLRLVEELAPTLVALEEALHTLRKRAAAPADRLDDFDRALTRLYAALFLKLGEGPSIVDRIERVEEQIEGGVRLGAGILERLEAIEAELAKGVRS